MTTLSGWFGDLVARLRGHRAPGVQDDAHSDAPESEDSSAGAEAPGYDADDEPRVVLPRGWFESWLVETGFLARYPHYAGVVARMDPIATYAVGTMAVALRRVDDPNARIQLLVNPRYFQEMPEYRAGILLHEIQHVVLGHLTNAKFHTVEHPRVMELAMELSANESITEDVPGGLHVPMFEELGVAAGQSTLERYRLLAEAYEGGRLSLVDWWCPRMLDVHRPRQRAAGRGSGLGDLLDARSDGATSRNWSRARGRAAPSHESEVAAMKRAIARHLRGERGGDDDPFSDRRRLAKQIDRLIVTSTGEVLDWRSVLRHAFPRRRLVTPDYLKPSRRFPARIGEIPGRTRRPPKPALLVGVDTSGSMSIDALTRVARELNELGRHARLTIMECDAAVHRVYPLAAPLGPFIGGGDTDFSPVFAAFHDARYDGLVYFTDGKGAMPASDETPVSRRVTAERGARGERVPTLWVLTHPDPFDAPFGSVVRLPVE